MFFCQSVRHYDCFCKFAYSVIVSIALQFVFFCDYHAGCNSHKGVDGTRDTPPFRGTFTCPWNVSLLTPSHRYRTSQVSGAFFFFCLCGIVNPLEDFSGWKYFRNVLYVVIYYLYKLYMKMFSCFNPLNDPKNLLLLCRFIQDSAQVLLCRLGINQSSRTGYGACTFANPGREINFFFW